MVDMENNLEMTFSSWLIYKHIVMVESAYANIVSVLQTVCSSSRFIIMQMHRQLILLIQVAWRCCSSLIIR